MGHLVTLAVAALAALPLQDFAKLRVEIPLETSLDALAARSTPVEPRRVPWHADAGAAFAAARASGRPVLVFELFGRLDDELC